MLGTGLSDHALAAIASARRAAAIERMASINLTVEMRPLAGLAAIVTPWKALAARALEPNVFHEPEFALAAAPVLGVDVQAGLVWSQSTPRELLGLFPVRLESRRYGLPLPLLCAWVHPFAPFGAPLVHRDLAEQATAAWLSHLATDPAMPSLLLMRYLGERGPFVSVLETVLARRGGASASYDRHERALLEPNGGRAGYLERGMSGKRRRDLARQWRALGRFDLARVERASGAEAAAALQDFLRLEADGWKGRARSAAASDPAIRRFVVGAVTALAPEEQVAIHRLMLGLKPIAALITLRSGGSAWCWKIAYDEAYAAFSPGKQLLVRVTQELLDDASLARVDSLATPGHPLMDTVWSERLAVVDRLISLKPDSFVPFALACRLESMRRLGVSAARAAREHWRGR